MVVFGFFFSGCSGITKNADFTKFNEKEKKYPEISIVMTSEELQYFRNRTTVINAFKESNMFKAIKSNNPYAPFSMELYLEGKNKSIETGDGFGKMMVGAGSLFLIPTDVEFEVKGHVKLRALGVVFDEFNVDTKFKTVFSMFHMGKDLGFSGAYRKAVEEILEKIKERDSFKKNYKKDTKISI